MAWIGQGEPFTNEEMMGPGGGVFSKEPDIRDSPEYQEAMNMIYTPDFGQFDFSQFGNDNDEEPVNFFGKSDEKVFHQVYKQMYELFKDTKGDGVFRVYAHGNFGYLVDENGYAVDTAKKFDVIMKSKNSNWKNVDKMKDPILILFACLSGQSTVQNDAIGKQISQAHPNLTVIAFNGFVTYDPKANGIKNVNAAQNSGDGRGGIVFYQNGEYLTGYRYNQFLKKYPNFK
ncbi:hypothetical protein PMI13_02328 [Chryseobacterium populi]|uniref:Uncharacterized protein n=2 Tax=Chryseobacterium populi TaxID=1144316 RepID=J2T0K4_9FLAO|nr:hypothetical protein PMI13_02328 [Chryseobacterium populi]